MPTYPGRDAFTGARRTDPSTSHVAAAMVDAKGQRAEIMRLVRGHDFSMTSPGWTADELDETIGWRVTTAGRRLSELCRAGIVVSAGERLTRSGRPAKVYRVVS